MPTPRKPALQHKIDGTFREDRHRTATATPIDPKPREGLQEGYRGAWAEIVTAGGEYLSQSDRLAVELAAVLMMRVRNGGSTAADCSQLANLLTKLGCTPAGRRGLDPVKQRDPEEDSPFFEFKQ